MRDYSTIITVAGRQVRTLSDILPSSPGLRMLFVAKTPALKSVEVGHYFQGRHGRNFWNRLKEYSLLRPTTQFEDDSLLDHGFGFTDIVKVPRDFGEEPSDSEYLAGAGRILDLIQAHRPRVVVFVYKRVLDQIVRLRFGVTSRATYGFNAEFEALFGSRVFAFPLPGTPCPAHAAVEAMSELVTAVTPV